MLHIHRYVALSVIGHRMCNRISLPNSHSTCHTSWPHPLAGQRCCGCGRENTRQQLHATSHDKLASETSEEREARLQQVHDRLAPKTTRPGYSRCDRLTIETSEEREARLQQVHDRLAPKTTRAGYSRCDRLTIETSEERETSLYSRCVIYRLASETTEER